MAAVFARTPWDLVPSRRPKQRHARGIVITERGHAFLRAMQRRDALTRAEQAACGDLYSPGTVTHPAESSA